MNQKGFTNITVVISAIILVGLASYFFVSQKTFSPEPEPKTDGVSTSTSSLNNQQQKTGNDKDSANGFRCSIRCTGAAPSAKVQGDCYNLLSQEQCTSYTSDQFPYGCQWQPRDYQCPPLP